jgi:hypothetical protein
MNKNQQIRRLPMTNPNHFRFRRGDFLAIGLVAAAAVAALLLFLPKEEVAGSVQVYQDGVLLRSVPLNQDQDFTVTGRYTNTVSVKDGAVAIIRSDCPGEDCVNCGWAQHPGKSIICLPNGVELRLVGTESDVDFVVG